MHIEIELKLAIKPADIPQLLQHPLFTQHAITEKNTQYLINTYYDTLSYELRQQGIGLRIREVEGKFLQTLKWSGKKIAGVSHRQEWEQAIPTPTLDYDIIPEATLRNFLQKKLTANEIIPLFKTDFYRSSWLLQFPNQTQIELAIDEGQIRSKQLTATICEIELELKQGDEQQLLQFSQQLQQHFHLTIEDDSKAARGYQLHAMAK